MTDEILKIKIESKELEEALEQLANRASDLTPLMKNITGIIKDSIEEQFDKEGVPQKWEELHPLTIKKRLKKGHWVGRILQVKGALVSSITSKYDDGSAVVGSNLTYARIHQLGGQCGRNKSTKIKARPFIVIRDKQEKEILNAVKSHLVD